MGRGRGKAKKQKVTAAREDTVSGEEERILPSRRRGRPQKTLKEDIGEVALKTEDGDDAKENGRKRKRSAQVKETIKSVKEDKMIETKSSLDDPKKSVGFRQYGSRRKNKPHRAAEAGVECK
ncbi:unnamed protein product [Malus baccata var. baccata]